MTEFGDERVRVRLSCERRGKRTMEDRCPACGFRTQEAAAFRPDPSAEDREREGVITPLVLPPGTPRGTVLIGRATVLIVTMNDVPGHRIVEVHGDVCGITVRARDYFSNVGARLRTVVGGEVAGYTKLLSEARAEARRRLADDALRLGANAVIAMRFDCNEIGGVMNEIADYGTRSHHHQA